MNAIEIRDLSKNFGAKQALCGFNMTVPLGAIYGFIGENGSGKSTTEKILCGLIPLSGGTISIMGKNYTDEEVKSSIGCLIEAPGCYPNYSVWNNLILQAKNLGIKNEAEEVRRVLRIVRMDGSASNKYKNCSLGMKQRIGIAMALMGNPKLLILDEPINGLDVDGMRIMREVLVDITRNMNCTVVISSHVLGELEKIATHYGIIRGGKMIKEMTASELDDECPKFVRVKTKDLQKTKQILFAKYSRIEEENECLKIYDAPSSGEITDLLCQKGVFVNEISTEKIGLEEYYINLMQGGNKRYE